MQWNRIRDSEETFPAILSRMAQSDPARVLARTVGGDMLTWGGLQVAVDSWAGRLVTLGVRKGDVVTTMLDSSLVSLALWLGLVRIGAIDATINSEFRGRMLAYAINTCTPALVVVERHYLEHLEAVAGDLQSIAKVLVIGGDATTSAQSSALPRAVFDRRESAADSHRF